MYLHYATRVAFALATLARATRDPASAASAVDVLSSVATASLEDAPGGSPAPFFHWKVGPSLDAPRSRAPVRVGGLDAFDVAVTARVVGDAAASVAAARGAPPPPSIPPQLAHVVAAADAMVAARLASPRALVSAGDPLDAGCAAVLAAWASHLSLHWAPRLAADAASALSSLWRDGAFAGPSNTRLAFREFGATLGAQVAAAGSERAVAEWRPRVAAVHSFWAAAGRLTAHDSDISPLMFASSMVPGAWQPGWEPEEGG